jgi:hypothetical protein
VPTLMMLKSKATWSFAVSKNAFGSNSCTNMINDDGKMQ